MNTDLKNKGGRPPGYISYRHTSYNNKEYVIATLEYKGGDINFIFDEEDFPVVEVRSWHVSSNNYISSAYLNEEGIRKEVYLHNIVMNRPLFTGKGISESVDHINRNGFDNRKENLRVISQSNQNINQTKKKRNVILPSKCGINPDDIPKHIWYVHSNGYHGDRFAIEFKTESIKWKGTSSKKIDLKEKLQQAKEKLEELYIEYPYLHPDYETEQKNALSISFEAIITII